VTHVSRLAQNRLEGRAGLGQAPLASLDLPPQMEQLVVSNAPFLATPWPA
jgi:hypothetical protein